MAGREAAIEGVDRAHGGRVLRCEIIATGVPTSFSMAEGNISGCVIASIPWTLRRIGTIFTPWPRPGRLQRSRPLILDPLALHPQSLRDIQDPKLAGTLKELAQLDGAFIVGNDGIRCHWGLCLRL